MATDNDSEPRRPRLPSPGDAAGSSGRLIIWFVVFLLVSFWAWGQFAAPQTPNISYTAFRQHLESGNVTRIEVTGSRIEGQLREPAVRVGAADDTLRYDAFVTILPSFGDDDLFPTLERQGVEVQARPEADTSWWPLLIMGLPFLLMIGFGYFLVRRMQTQGQSIFSVRKSQAKLYDRESEHTTFDDVAGAEGAKMELREIVAFLESPDKIQLLGGDVPHGVLLVGPPGTGKTLLARAVAGEAGVPFFSITGSDFMEMFVGVGASRVRDLFKEAKKASPSIIFIDELDSIGRRRGAGVGGGHDEREQTLNQLLSEMDGFEANESVIVMAASNRPDILDPALLRPGRFDRRITVDLPTQRHREQILRIHARKKPLADDVDLEQVARSTPGFSGADLENLLNEGALLAARKDRSKITAEDIDEARDKVMMGLERKGLMLTDEERRLLAYHEAGHAITAAVLPNADPIHKVTIIPRGQAMGVTQQLPETEKYLYRREYMLDRMAVMMGGRAAEDLVFDTSTSGAENDLKQVIGLARKMVLDWGMSDRFRNVAFGGQRTEVFLGEQLSQSREYSEQTAREVDEEVQAILDAAYGRALEMLQTHRMALDGLAEALLANEVVSGAEVLALVGLPARESVETGNGTPGRAPGTE